MSVRKRNEWLEADASDDDQEEGYNSEAQEESRGAIAGRSIKRRKVDDEESDGEDSISEGEEDSPDRDPMHPRSTREISQKQKADQALPDNDNEDEDQDNDPKASAAAIQDNATPLSDLDEVSLQDPKKSSSSTSALKPLSAKQLSKSQRAAAKTGVIYLSRIPPFMKPHTLRSLLTPYGSIGRIFLSPEDAAQHTRRVRSGGNKKKSYTDGWVEFLSKKDAKSAADVLNGNIIGGRKGGFYHDDLWNVRYLRGFKWAHLTEQMAAENAERAARLRVEISRSRREDREFVAGVERGKMLEGIGRKKKGAGGGEDGVDGGERPRVFRQNEARSKMHGEERKVKEQPEETARVLSKLF